jgi:hypothetical protein
MRTLAAHARWHRFRLAETDAAFIFVGVDQLFVLSIWQVLLPVAFVSSPVLISVLADKRGPHRQSHLIPLAVVAYSLDQRLVGQPLTSHAVNETIKPRQSVVLDVAFIQAERKFVHVATKVFFACVMIQADQPALHYRENALDRIGGYIVANELASAMVDGIVLEESADACIRPRFVGVNGRADLDILQDRLLDRGRIRPGNRHGDCSPAALAHSKNRRFTDRAVPSLEFLVFMLVGFLAADERFVDFDDAFEFGQVPPAAGLAEPMQDEPSRLLGNPDFLRQLHRGNALAGRHKQVHRVNPLVQRNVAALKYRASAHCEVFLALIAAVKTASTFRYPLAQAADRATRAVRPQPTFKVGSGRLLVREHLEKLEGRDCALAHGLVLNSCPKYRAKNRGSQVYNSRVQGKLSRSVKGAF